MIGRPLRDVCSSTDVTKPLYPLAERYVRVHLSREGGRFKGLGYRKYPGGQWLLSDADVEAIKDRCRVEQPVDLDGLHPSGLSQHSRTLREIQRSGRAS